MQPTGKFLAQIVPIILIGSRWLMAPLYLGLIAALVVLIVETFVDIEQTAKSDVLWRVAILLAFVVVGVMLAWMDRLAERRPE